MPPAPSPQAEQRIKKWLTGINLTVSAFALFLLFFYLDYWRVTAKGSIYPLISVLDWMLLAFAVVNALGLLFRASAYLTLRVDPKGWAVASLVVHILAIMIAYFALLTLPTSPGA